MGFCLLVCLTVVCRCLCVLPILSADFYCLDVYLFVFCDLCFSLLRVCFVWFTVLFWD